MKSIPAAALCFAAATASASLIDVPIRLMSYNIRWAIPVPGIGEAHWAVRRPLLASQLAYETAGRPESLICMQEVVHQQLLDIREDLGAGAWAHLGVGRDDGGTAGEYSPVLYRPDAWDVERNRTYWLSATPDVPSRGWDAALPRVATVARLRHRATGAPLVVVCTHFDHLGQQARERSADLVVSIAAEWEEAGAGGEPRAPVFLGGDLNVEPSNEAYKRLVAPGAMLDARDVVAPSRRHGNTKTYTGFTTISWDDKQLDHIFVRDPAAGGVKLGTYAVLSNRYDDGTFISDHRPVVVDAELRVNQSTMAS